MPPSQAGEADQEQGETQGQETTQAQEGQEGRELSPLKSPLSTPT